MRGALLYNYYVKKHNVENKHQLIQEGEKIKFMYLKTPNPIHENCISFFGELPKEFGLEKYVDYQTQFEKSFLEPLKNVLQCIGWTHEKTITISKLLFMSKKIFVVTWTNHVVGQVGPEDIKCFEDYDTAMAFAKLMRNNYNYVNFYEERVDQWDS